MTDETARAVDVEIARLITETQRLGAETARLNAETDLTRMKRVMLPMATGAALATAFGGLLAFLLTDA